MICIDLYDLVGGEPALLQGAKMCAHGRQVLGPAFVRRDTDLQASRYTNPCLSVPTAFATVYDMCMEQEHTGELKLPHTTGNEGRKGKGSWPGCGPKGVYKVGV